MRKYGGAVSKDLSAPRARQRCTPRPFYHAAKIKANTGFQPRMPTTFFRTEGTE
jgi:hypothetical protein